MTQTYKIVQEIDGQLTATRPTDIFAWAEVAGFKFAGIENRSVLRPELQGQPKFAGLIGPQWGGDENGIPCIRYESESAYRILSA